jgi:hypothetical protein
MAWNIVKGCFGLFSLNNVSCHGSVYKCWRRWRLKIEKKERMNFDGIMIYSNGTYGKK